MSAAALVAVFAAGCADGSGGGSAGGSAALSCDALAAAEERSGTEAEFFAEMAVLAASVDATVEVPEGAEAGEVSADHDGDVAAAFRRLEAASRRFAERHPEVEDRSGAAVEALGSEERATLDAELAEMITEFEDDFQVTWAWIGDVESELGCR